MAAAARGGVLSQVVTKVTDPKRADYGKETVTTYGKTKYGATVPVSTTVTKPSSGGGSSQVKVVEVSTPQLAVPQETRPVSTPTVSPVETPTLGMSIAPALVKTEAKPTTFGESALSTILKGAEQTAQTVTTPRLSGLGVPTTPTIPGDTKSVSTPTPGITSYKGYMEPTGGLAETLGVSKITQPKIEKPVVISKSLTTGLSSALGIKPTTVETVGGTVSTAFPEKYDVTTLFKPSVTTTRVEMPTQSFVGRVDPELGMKQLKQLETEQQELLNEYNKVTSALTPEKTVNIEVQSQVLKNIGEKLENTVMDIQRDEDILKTRLKNINLYDKQDVDNYNTDLERYRQRVEQFNKEIDAYNKQYGEYTKEFENYNARIREATSLSNAINTRNVMAEDILQNVNRSLIPEAIRAPTVEAPKKYGPGEGAFDYPFLSWKGQAERFGAAGKSIYLGATSPIRWIWGDKNKIKVTEGTIHNPFVRGLVEAAANQPYIAALPIAIAGLPAGAAAAVPGLATTGSYIGTIGTTIGLSTAAAEGYGTLAEKGKIPFITGIKEPLFNKQYTPQMDKEARTVLLGSISEARLLPTTLTGATGEWNPVAWVAEGVNLGFMSEARRQQGINALVDYYKQQGLSDTEADYRISKVQEGIKISNQREWVELASAGIGTNILGAKGVTIAQKFVAPKITKGVPLLYGAKNIPLVGKTFLGKALSEASTKTGARYLATRILGMAPAGALEGMYFTGAQLGGRYGAEMKPSDYVRGAIIGGISAPLAQMYIERNFPRTAFGGVERPEVAYTKVFGKKLSKPTIIERPTARETVLFVSDPLEPISDALTKMIPDIAKGVRTTVAPFTTAVTQGYTWTTDKGVYKFTPAWAPTYSQVLAETKAPKSVKPVTTAVTDVVPLVKEMELVSKTKTVPRGAIQTLVREPTYVAPRPLTSTVMELQTQPLTQVLPQTQLPVQPLTSTLTNVELLAKVQPTVSVQPYVYPSVQPQVQTQPNVITVDKFPPVVGWEGSLGESVAGAYKKRGYKEWLIANPIAQYGEEWMARQQAKAVAVEAAIAGRQQFRLAPQGMQVINRVLPQQFVMPQQQQFYKVEPQETTRQRAQRAVERGFGTLTPLTSSKVSGMFKSRKAYKVPKMPNVIKPHKGWM